MQIEMVENESLEEIAGPKLQTICPTKESTKIRVWESITNQKSLSS